MALGVKVANFRIEIEEDGRILEEDFPLNNILDIDVVENFPVYVGVARLLKAVVRRIGIVFVVTDVRSIVFIIDIVRDFLRLDIDVAIDFRIEGLFGPIVAVDMAGDAPSIVGVATISTNIVNKKAIVLGVSINVNRRLGIEILIGVYVDVL